MQRTIRSIKSSPAVAIAAACVVVASLYYARGVLMPLAMAVLLAFLLKPLAGLLERWRLGRVAPVFLSVLLAMGVVGLLGWVMETQFINVADRLPDLREEIQRKIADLHGLSGKLGQATLNVEKAVREAAGPASPQPVTVPATPDEPDRPQVSPQNPLPVRNYPEALSGADNITNLLIQTLRPLATAGLVIVFAVFMLLKREDLRDRIIRLSSRGRVNFSTRAVDDAAARISRYLLTQLLINTAYGLMVALGLWVIGLTLGAAEGGFPNLLLWGLLCGVLRFVPYVGPVIGAAFPLAIAFGFFHGNSVFLVALLMFVGLEIVVSQFIEPMLYRSRTGISALAILVSAVFWTAVWGPVGLLLSVPLTVLLVVMGKYVPQLEFLNILLGIEPVLAPPERIYQRLLALDQEEAVELAQAYAQEHSVEALYPVLTMSTHDSHRGKLDSRRQRFIHKSLRVIVEEMGERQPLPPEPLPEPAPQAPTPDDGKPGAARPGPSGKAPPPPALRAQVPAGCTVNVLVLSAGEEADEIAGLMLAQLLEGRGYRAVVSTALSPVGDVLAMVDERQAHVVCVSAMPPGCVARARTLCRQLHDKHADLRIIVGLWAFRGELASTNSRLTQTALRQLVINLREAQEHIDRLAEPFLAAGKAAGDSSAGVLILSSSAPETPTERGLPKERP
jgi:predicted PurR-regulated permease PerM/methylmalonyl-CoA mutase cobalamin-binding subunit